MPLTSLCTLDPRLDMSGHFTPHVSAESAPLPGHQIPNPSEVKYPPYVAKNVIVRGAGVMGSPNLFLFLLESDPNMHAKFRNPSTT